MKWSTSEYEDLRLALGPATNAVRRRVQAVGSAIDALICARIEEHATEHYRDGMALYHTEAGHDVEDCVDDLLQTMLTSPGSETS